MPSGLARPEGAHAAPRRSRVKSLAIIVSRGETNSLVQVATLLMAAVGSGLAVRVFFRDEAIYRIEELRGTADPKLKDALGDVKQHIQNVLQDLRATAKELRPPTIFNFGLENAIRSHANDILEKHPNLNIYLSLAHDRQILPEKVRLALFRIFQQSLANVIRHSRATEVHVRFSFDAEEAYLEITDNGKGFEVPSNWIDFVRQGHYGLAGAAERANTLGGMFKVNSKPGYSTTIQVTIPWKDSIE